jgi:hypothetical protein
VNLFQIFAIIVVGSLFVLTLVGMLRGWATRREGVVWAVVWLTAGVAIAWPKVTAVVAHVLGIGRGADLVLYCAVVVMLIGFLTVYARLRRIQHDLTILVRHLAIRDVVITPPTTRPTDITQTDRPAQSDAPGHHLG